MADVREVAERARGKRTWSIREIRAALPKMNPRLVEAAFRRVWGSAARSTVGPDGWHAPPHARAIHWFQRGWAICGWGSVGTWFGRPEAFDDERGECPACRRAIERTKAA